jgi:hypothetical protein
MDHPTSPDPQTPCVWCPGCSTSVPLQDPLLLVEFVPIAAKLGMDGRFEWGYDTFLDYTHMPCGFRVRLSDHATWDDVLFEYTHTSEAWIEVDTPDGYVESEHDSGHWPFSAAVQHDTERWGPTLVTMREAHAEALRLLYERMGDESA